MAKHLSYLKYVLKHKWCTLIECIKLGITWRGIVHDLSKFSKAEWGPYVEWFYGERITGIPYSTKLKRGTTVKYTGAYRMEPDKSGEHVVVDCKKGTTIEVCETNCREEPDDNYYIQLLPLTAKQNFDMAWNNHQKQNKHHWQYWLLTMDDEKDNKVLEMPEEYMLEMIADWNGAGKAITGKIDTKAWYLKRRERFKKNLHPKTRRSIEIYLGIPKQHFDVMYVESNMEFSE